MRGPEICLDFEALRSNFELLSRLTPEGNLHADPLPVFPVVKAQAYGLSAFEIAQELENQFDEKRLPYFCVARWCEAQELRQKGIRRPLLVLSQYSFEELRDTPLENVSLILSSLGDLALLKKLSPEQKSKIKSLHLDLDTGLNRLGFKISQQDGDFQNLSQLLGEISKIGIPVDGIASHLARSEEDPQKGSTQQTRLLDSFMHELKNIWNQFFKTDFPKWVHLNNSLGSCLNDCAYETARRPGILLWGAHSHSQARADFEKNYPQYQFKPVLSLRAPIRKTLWIHPSEGIGYNHRFQASQKTLIGIVTMGYADGLSRSLSTNAIQSQNSRLKFWVEGFAAPISGTVSMDMVMIDLGSHPQAKEIAQKVSQNEVVWAEWVGEHQRIEEHADTLNTISYEVLCAFNQRVKRMRFTP